MFRNALISVSTVDATPDAIGETIVARNEPFVPDCCPHCQVTTGGAAYEIQNCASGNQPEGCIIRQPWGRSLEDDLGVDTFRGNRCQRLGAGFPNISRRGNFVTECFRRALGNILL